MAKCLWCPIVLLLLTPALVASPCARYPPGSEVLAPPNLYSSGGILTVDLSYNTAKDSFGRTLYCFTTPSGDQSPTLHIHPGDHLIVHVKNNLPAPAPAASMHMVTSAHVCGAAMMDSSSVNIHYHGSYISPACHSDEAIYTLINSGEAFTYDVAFPADEPPGLYWYHPHVHGMAEAAVQGGASGAIIVEGIESLQSSVAGLRQRLLIIRDQTVAGLPKPGGSVPAWDLSLNYIPIAYPAFTPAVIRVLRGELEFWRVLNSSADTTLDLEVRYDGVAQTMNLVALDGVAVGMESGRRTGTPIPVTRFHLPPAARVEFLIRMPSARVRTAQFLTRTVDTGPDGDNVPRRVIANIAAGTVSHGAVRPAVVKAVPPPQRFVGLAREPVTRTRHLFFSETETQYFITVDGETPAAFSPDNPPGIVATQGDVEDWIIENRTGENHAFHLHQLHFLVVSQTNFEVNGSRPVEAIQGQVLDMIDVPYWDGDPSHPYPSVTLRVDFRGPIAGDFVYHCHILEHEDGGMMGTIRVLPPPVRRTSRR